MIYQLRENHSKKAYWLRGPRSKLGILCDSAANTNSWNDCQNEGRWKFGGSGVVGEESWALTF
jgi:hypothetical protein